MALVGVFATSAYAADEVTPSNKVPLVLRNGCSVGWVSVEHKPGPRGGELWVTYKLCDRHHHNGNETLEEQRRHHEEEYRFVAINLAVGKKLCQIPVHHGDPAVWRFPWQRRFHHPKDEYTVRVPVWTLDKHHWHWHWHDHAIEVLTDALDGAEADASVEEHFNNGKGATVYFAAQAVIEKCERCERHWRDHDRIGDTALLDEFHFDNDHRHHHYKPVRRTVWAQGQRFPFARCSWGMWFKLNCTNPNGG
jgi:hypothetical protein